MTDIVERLQEMVCTGEVRPDCGDRNCETAWEAVYEMKRLRGIVRDAEPLLRHLRDFTRKIGDFEERDEAQDVLDRIRGKDDDS